MTMMGARQARRYFVQGRVQGVGFRYWTIGRARKLGLVGWVRNCRDGSVELLAAGTQDSLDALAAALWGGPPAAKVLKVETGPVSAAEISGLAALAGFEQVATAD
ncbi:acylphosphatase [Ferrovibrio sp.]|uniref:acylphosphatase n=1 Tax=Ferrovibrio sp. TaxID=1917215 RepID=UPI0025B9B733|nr:acylphosphatase [Ferrovibrio sp.]